jgi:hypothetical protein
MTSGDKHDLRTQFLTDTMLSINKSATVENKETGNPSKLTNRNRENNSLPKGKFFLYSIRSCYGSHVNVQRRTIHGIFGHDT